MVLRPQVRTDVKVNLSLIEPAGDGVVAILGSAQWGPFDQLQTLSSLNDGLTIFKDDSTTVTTLTMTKGLDMLYRNGAGTVLAMRVGDGTQASSSITLQSGSTNVITIYGKYKGSYGNNVQVTVTENGSNRNLKVTDGVITENYTNSGDGYDENIALADAVTAGSQLVTATSTSNTYLVSALTATNLSGGSDGSASITASNYTTAFDNYLADQDFNYLVVPGTTADSFHSTMVAKMNTRAETDRKYASFISGIAQDETIATAADRTASGKRIALLAPSFRYTNRISGTVQYLDGSYLACAYAGLLATLFPEDSPTHKVLNTEGVIVNTTTLKDYYNKGEQEQLLESRIVPVSLISGSERVVRGVTRITSTSSVFYLQNITTIVDYIRKQLEDTLNDFIGNPNLQRVRDVIARTCDNILETAKRDEIIEDYQDSVVTAGASADTVDVAITVKPTFAVEFINLNLTIDNVSN